ncbi:hypothetical protein C8R42DRAFT_584860, partial [Lentinula raphanica]
SLQLLFGLIEHLPDIYLDKIQLESCQDIEDELYCTYGLTISLSTIWCTLRRLGISNKQLSKTASEHSEETHMEFTFEMGGLPPEYLVFADECSVNLHTTYWFNGWNYHGI